MPPPEGVLHSDRGDRRGGDQRGADERSDRGGRNASSGQQDDKSKSKSKNKSDR